MSLRRQRTACRFAGLLFAALGGIAVAQDNQQDAEAALAALNAAIEASRAALSTSRRELDQEEQALRDIELDIQDNLAQQRRLNTEQDQQRERRQQLQTKRDEHLAQLETSRDQLAAQVRAAWRLGSESRLKLVLNADSPARLGRTLAYHDHFSRAQARRIDELRTALAGLDQVARDMAQVMEALASSAEALQRSASELDRRRDERAGLTAALEQRIRSESERLAELEQDRADLEQLLQRLQDALADIPADLGQHLHPTALRGQLPMPLDGRVLKAFGQQRAPGLTWRGWLIEARSGDTVRAIAYGRVAYADWLRGYGLLLIIDHGDGFMSLYGHNESLQHGVGDWVQPGEVVATAGGHGDAGNGLYFELRNAGRAVDPATWIDR